MVKMTENRRRRGQSRQTPLTLEDHLVFTMKTTEKPMRQPGSKRLNTGRWTRDEHLKFLAGLNKFGREWKKVASGIPTRTPAQIRSHAQKYFAKLKKDKLGMLCNASSTRSCKRKRPKSSSSDDSNDEEEEQSFRIHRRPFSPTNGTNRRSPGKKARVVAPRRGETISECYEESMGSMRRLEQAIKLLLRRRVALVREYLRTATSSASEGEPENSQEAISSIDQETRRQFQAARRLTVHPRSRDLVSRGWLTKLGQLIRREQRQMGLQDVGFVDFDVSDEPDAADNAKGGGSMRKILWIHELYPSVKGERYSCEVPSPDTLYSSASAESRARLQGLAEDEICAVQVLSCVSSSRRPNGESDDVKSEDDSPMRQSQLKRSRMSRAGRGAKSDSDDSDSDAERHLHAQAGGAGSPSGSWAESSVQRRQVAREVEEDEEDEAAENRDFNAPRLYQFRTGHIPASPNSV